MRSLPARISSRRRHRSQFACPNSTPRQAFRGKEDIVVPTIAWHALQPRQALFLQGKSERLTLLLLVPTGRTYLLPPEPPVPSSMRNAVRCRSISLRSPTLPMPPRKPPVQLSPCI